MNGSESRYKLAVGIEYERHKDAAPCVSVKGEELLADRVVELARRFAVPVVENPELARALNAIEIEQQIPEALFQAVAIVLDRLERGLC